MGTKEEYTLEDRILETVVYILQKLFILAEDHISLNISKVLAVANTAGCMLCIASVDCVYWGRVLVGVAFFGILALFFTSLVFFIEEGIDLNDEEEDDL